jgi:hypothetical protein
MIMKIAVDLSLLAIGFARIPAGVGDSLASLTQRSLSVSVSSTQLFHVQPIVEGSARVQVGVTVRIEPTRRERVLHSQIGPRDPRAEFQCTDFKKVGVRGIFDMVIPTLREHV